MEASYVCHSPARSVAREKIVVRANLPNWSQKLKPSRKENMALGSPIYQWMYRSHRFVLSFSNLKTDTPPSCAITPADCI